MMEDRPDHMASLVAHLRAYGTNPLSLDGAQVPDLAALYRRRGRFGDAHVDALLVHHPDHSEADPRTVLAMEMRTPSTTRWSETRGLRDPPLVYRIRWRETGRERSLAIATFDAFLFDVWRALNSEQFIPDVQESYLHAPATGSQQLVLPFTDLPRT